MKLCLFGMKIGSNNIMRLCSFDAMELKSSLISPISYSRQHDHAITKSDDIINLPSERLDLSIIWSDLGKIIQIQHHIIIMYRIYLYLITLYLSSSSQESYSKPDLLRPKMWDNIFNLADKYFSETLPVPWVMKMSQHLSQAHDQPVLLPPCVGMYVWMYVYFAKIVIW